MKTVRFSNVVQKSGKPEVYLLLSETDPVFQKALQADRVMTLSDESHGSGTEFGTVGYDKKRRGQLLLFPHSLKSFAGMKVVGIKYDMFSQGGSEPGDIRPADSPSRTKAAKKARSKLSHTKASAKSHQRKEAGSIHEKVIPFPKEKKEEDDHDDGDLKACVRQAMRALEKGNSVAAYNLLKRIVASP